MVRNIEIDEAESQYSKILAYKDNLVQELLTALRESERRKIQALAAIELLSKNKPVVRERKIVYAALYILEGTTVTKKIIEAVRRYKKSYFELTEGK